MFFEELEEILIMADIGVNTVMEFIDRLKRRVKKENIEIGRKKGITLFSRISVIGILDYV